MAKLSFSLHVKKVHEFLIPLKNNRFTPPIMRGRRSQEGEWQKIASGAMFTRGISAAFKEFIGFLKKEETNKKREKASFVGCTILKILQLEND